MRHLITKELFAYWNVLRGKRSAPERRDIDPDVIRSLLADTFILEADEDHNFMFRLSGMRTNALFDGELRQQPFADLWQTDDHTSIPDLLRGVCDEMKPLTAGAEAQCGEQIISLELLILPLRYNGRTHSRLLGCISPMREPPCGVALSTLRLISHRFITPSQVPVLAQRALQTPRDRLPFFERRHLPLAPHVPRPRVWKHLRVYEGGR